VNGAPGRILALGPAKYGKVFARPHVAFFRSDVLRIAGVRFAPHRLVVIPITSVGATCPAACHAVQFRFSGFAERLVCLGVFKNAAAIGQSRAEFFGAAQPTPTVSIAQNWTFGICGARRLLAVFVDDANDG
jgi:hypothetical protein